MPTVLAITGSGGVSVALEIVPNTANARWADTLSGTPTNSQPFSFERGKWHDVTLKISPNSDGTVNALCGADSVGYARTVTPLGTLGTAVMSAGVTSTTTQPIELVYDNVVALAEMSP